jgi:hypothetical protein
MLEGVNERILAEKNMLLEVNIAEIDDENYTAHVKAALFNPEKFIPNGGPVTVKSITVTAKGNSHNDAQVNGLNLAAKLLGF